MAVYEDMYVHMYMHVAFHWPSTFACVCVCVWMQKMRLHRKEEKSNTSRFALTISFPFFPTQELQWRHGLLVCIQNPCEQGLFNNVCVYGPIGLKFWRNLDIILSKVLVQIRKLYILFDAHKSTLKIKLLNFGGGGRGYQILKYTWSAYGIQKFSCQIWYL